MRDILYFTSPTCVPCKVFGPQLQNFVDNRDDVTLTKIVNDSDDAMEAFINHSVRAVPTLILQEDGEEITRTMGSMNEKEFTLFVETQG